jgi:hypothetical protein
MLTKEFLCKREVLGKRSPHSFTPPLSVVGVSSTIIDGLSSLATLHNTVCAYFTSYQNLSLGNLGSDNEFRSVVGILI